MATTMSQTWVSMRDGVRLFSRLFRPADTAGPLPAVLMRNPYNSGIAPPIWNGLCETLAAQGYAVVNQDVRGTNRSEGVFRPFFQEGEDGYDAIEWAATQPWCDGRVGIWGISYLGVCAMQAAVLRPPSLVAVAAQVTASDYHDHWVYENGLVNSHFIEAWTAGFAQDQRWRREREGTAGDEEQGQAERPGFWAEWMKHPLYDDYWRAADLTERCREIEVPVLLKGGWFDLFAPGTIALYQGLSARDGAAPAPVTRLEMTPGCHGPWTSTILRFPGVLDAMPDMDPAWWDRWLKDAPPPSGAGEAPVRLYVMSPPVEGTTDEGRWLDLPSYPDDRPRTRFALASEGEARGSHGGARLVREGAPVGLPDSFVHDPADPVPTLGGALASADLSMPAGVVDQSPLSRREDVLIYRIAPLEQAVTLVGPVKLIFWASSSAAETQFSVKLAVARPDGRVLNFLDRMISSNLRAGSRGSADPAPAGEPCRYELELGHTALQVQAGLRLELHIASSNYPRFAAGTVHDRQGGATEKQVQTIFHDAGHPSYLEVALLSG